MLATALLPASTAHAATTRDHPSLTILGGIGDLLEGIIGQAVPTGWLFDGIVATLPQVRSAIGAEPLWERGYTGKGVGVALIDTGVVPVDGLTSGNVVNGPDLSFESQCPPCATSTRSATARTWPASSPGATAGTLGPVPGRRARRRS